MKENLLSTSPWLDNLEYDWRELEKLGWQIDIHKNEFLFHLGDDVKFVYLVKNGRIRMFLDSMNGQEKAIAIIGKNGLLGESCVYSENKHITNAIAATDSRLVAIPSKLFKQEILKEKHAVQVFEWMSVKTNLLVLQSLYLAFGSSYQRVCDSIIQLGLTYGEKQGKNKVLIPISFTHQELADLIGTTRVTVANHLNNLIGEGVVSRKKQYYCIEDLSKLTDKLID